jgi:hypothetical protein
VLMLDVLLPKVQSAGKLTKRGAMLWSRGGRSLTRVEVFVTSPRADGQAGF